MSAYFWKKFNELGLFYILKIHKKCLENRVFKAFFVQNDKNTEGVLFAIMVLCLH